MPNVFKSQKINQSDSIAIEGKSVSFSLNSANGSNSFIRVIYFYVLPDALFYGVKIGMATCHPDETFWHAIKTRIGKQVHELGLSEEDYLKYGNNREVIHWGVALDSKSDSFKDYYVHQAIRSKLSGIVVKDQEWFINVAPETLIEIFEKCRNKDIRKEIYTPREEQRECVDALLSYFAKHPKGERFLLNCKMRFGKCYTTYKYCEEANLGKILILTFVPAVEESWREDLSHIRKDYDYFTDFNLQKDTFDFRLISNPFVMFLSLQNYLGKDKDKKIKEKIRKLQGEHFDLVILDEYHFGAWNDRTQETMEDLDETYQKELKKANGYEILNKLHIQTDKTICLSGTPFKALAKGEFTDENSYTYSYFDEQRKKYPIPDDNLSVNPDYAMFPDMKIFGYNMSTLFPDLTQNCASSDKILKRTYFSLNEFFKTEKDSNYALDNKFVYEGAVRYWLEILKGMSPKGRNFPYANPAMLEANKHTLWLMPSVNACEALTELLKKDEYFSQYRIINLSDKNVGAGKQAYDYLMREIDASSHSLTTKGRTIAITVNKLTIGVTVRPWSGVFVLKDLASPEQYFQAIFRIQTPNRLSDGSWKSAGFVYDFNIDRAAALLLRYAEQSESQGGLEKMKIAELIVRYLPIFMNGDMDHPISKDVLYQLAEYGDTSGESLSKKIADTSRTTRILDEETIAEMLDDKEIADIIKSVFAHAKFQKAKTRTPPSVPDDGYKSNEAKLGRDMGYELGQKDYKKYLDFDDEHIQEEFDKNLKEYVKQCCPKDYDEVRQRNFIKGFSSGYDRGVNAPVKKMLCGKEDGLKFVEKVREEFGPNIHYIPDTRHDIENFVRHYLNDINNIPEDCRKSLMRRWYYDSFRRAVISTLRPMVKAVEGGSVEDADNVLRHILSRLFEFLFISVYRETTFDEIFKNADPQVFLEAVGITKEQFEKLNKYHIFQENVLNNYIKEFFHNEALGKDLDKLTDAERERYRNSFDWFGFGINPNRQ